MNATLYDIIERLHQLDPDTIIKEGFGFPMSYRGYYDQLAFDPVENARVGDMLDHAESALDQEFEGYKGGVYTMGGGVGCYIATFGGTTDRAISMYDLDKWSEV